MGLVCYATLEYDGKRYLIKDPTTISDEEDVEHGKYLRKFDWEENNWSCDCNRALFIQRQHDINFTTGNEDPDEYEDGTGLAGGPNVTCGNKIKLVKLEFKEEDNESKTEKDKQMGRKGSVSVSAQN